MATRSVFDRHRLDLVGVLGLPPTSGVKLRVASKYHSETEEWITSVAWPYSHKKEQGTGTETWMDPANMTLSDHSWM